MVDSRFFPMEKLHLQSSEYKKEKIRKTWQKAESKVRLAYFC